LIENLILFDIDIVLEIEVYTRKHSAYRSVWFFHIFFGGDSGESFNEDSNEFFIEDSGDFVGEDSGEN
jgi:hypothetical protein